MTCRRKVCNCFLLHAGATLRASRLCRACACALPIAGPDSHDAVADGGAATRCQGLPQTMHRCRTRHRANPYLGAHCVRNKALRAALMKQVETSERVIFTLGGAALQVLAPAAISLRDRQGLCPSQHQRLYARSKSCVS
jgi:hypothetical protein